MKNFLVAVSVMLIISALASSTYAMGTKPRQEDIFLTKCSKCHKIDRIVEAHKKGLLTKETLSKMMGKKDADLTQDDIDSIYDYLNPLSQYYQMAPTQ